MIDRVQLVPSGMFELSVFDRGELVSHERGPNLVVAAARASLAQLLGGVIDRRITHVGVGVNGAAPQAGDVGLTGVVKRAILGVSYPEPGQVAIQWMLDELDADGLAITEFGLFSADGTLFARKVRGAPINKNYRIRLEGVWTIQV